MRSLARIILIVATAAVLLVPVGRTRAAIPLGRLAIGDSVMLGAKGDLVARGFRVNATVSRQFRDAVLALGQDLPHLWNAPTTSSKDRKRMLRLVLKDITITKAAKTVTLQIRWHGGATE